MQGDIPYNPSYVISPFNVPLPPPARYRPVTAPLPPCYSPRYLPATSPPPPRHIPVNAPLPAQIFARMRITKEQQCGESWRALDVSQFSSSHLTQISTTGRVVWGVDNKVLPHPLSHAHFPFLSLSPSLSHFFPISFCFCFSLLLICRMAFPFIYCL